MAKMAFSASPESVILRVKLMNSSVSTGAGLTGLTFESTGLIIATMKIGDATTTAYTVAAGNVETISTLGTYAAPTAGKCRFKEVDATNHPGVYELQFANARFASTTQLLISILGATNLAQYDGEIDINVSDTNVTKINGVATTSVTTINANQGTTQPVNFTGTGASALVKGDTVDIAGAAVNAAAAQLGVNVVQLGADAQTVTDLKDFADTGYNPITHKVAGVVLTDTCTTNTDMRGTNSAALASVCTEARLAELDAANLPANIDTIAIDVAGLDGAAMRGTDSAALATALSTAQSDLTQIKGDTTTDIPAQLTAIAAYLDTEIADILTDTGTTIPALIAALNNLSIADVRTILGVNSSNQCAELSQAAPAATPSIAAAVMLAYMKLRNKETATSAERAIYNDAGTKIAKAVVSDDGTTFTKAEFGSGA